MKEEKKKEHPALSPEALLAKARVYVHRALKARAEPDIDAYQLWAALSLELLAKAALARLHPSLIVETSNPNSLLEACGIDTGTPVRTIDAHLVFTRLKHAVPNFGTPIAEASKSLASRRNAELHSGQAALAGMPLDSWEGDFWSASQLILDSMHLDLDNWLGPAAKEPKQFLAHLQEAKSRAATQRIAHAAEMFTVGPDGKKRSKKEQDELREKSQSLMAWMLNEGFRYHADERWSCECPACHSKAFLGGDRIYTEPLDDQDGVEPGMEAVEIGYSPNEFYCPTCQLHLVGGEALAAAEMGEIHEVQDEREIEYEPDYGND